MARHFLCAALGVVTLLILLPLSTAGPEAEPRYEEKLRKVLAVQAALREGREHLQRGNCQAAVRALEREVWNANGDKDYLAALEAAYRGGINEVQKTNPELAATYAGRLAALDPGSRLDQPKNNPPALAALAGTTPAPVKQTDSPATVRGAMDYSKTPAVTEHDPSSNDKAGSVVAKADQEFRDKHYLAAAKLYQQAYNLDPNATVAAQECWAYCKLTNVAEALNQPAASPAATQEMVKEVRLAMAMSPKLDTLGQSLLRSLQDRAGSNKTPAVSEHVAEAVIPMRHLPKQGQWSVLETSNFRILHTQTPEMAEKAARIAEQTRTSMSMKWFGDNSGTWNPCCELYLHATSQDYSKATGVPAQSPGHSTVRCNGERVLSRRIDIRCDDANWPVGVLPHETTHVVLAGRFGDSSVPRWADEGMAVLAEPRDRIERHLRNLPMHRDERTLFNVGQLMQLNDYPEPRYIGPFYAQSVSLVEYLSSLKGATEYTAFLRDGLRSGYEPALKKHFGITGFADLDRRWQQYAFRQSGAAE